MTCEHESIGHKCKDCNEFEYDIGYDDGRQQERDDYKEHYKNVMKEPISDFLKLKSIENWINSRCK